MPQILVFDFIGWYEAVVAFLNDLYIAALKREFEQCDHFTWHERRRHRAAGKIRKFLRAAGDVLTRPGAKAPVRDWVAAVRGRLRSAWAGIVQRASASFIGQTVASMVSRPSCRSAAMRLWPSITR
jgi:hypothetical protein